MGAGAIPFTAIADYFSIYELQDFDEFLYLMRRMDITFLELNATSNKEGTKKNGSSNTNKKNPNKGR